MRTDGKLRIVARREDRTREMGLRHFFDTWGPFLLKRIEDGLTITFDGDGDAGLRGLALKVGAGEPAESVQGRCPFESFQWPLFARPDYAGTLGETVLRFVDDAGERPLASLSRDTAHVHVDLFRDIGRCLQGHFSSNPRAGRSPEFLRILPPVADGYERMLVHLILRAQGREDTVPTPVQWPDGKPFAVLLTHDVDRTRKSFQYITHAWQALRGSDPSGPWRQLRSFRRRIRGEEPYWTFDRILSLEERYGVRSTFFFLHEQGRPSLDPQTWKLFLGRYRIDAPGVASIIHRLLERGWEVGLHGSFGSATYPTLLRKEKEVLEGVSRTAVAGVRQHYFRLMGGSTWRVQEGMGFEYDMSVGSARQLGFPSGTSLPYHPWPTEASEPFRLLEIPTALMDTALLAGNRLRFSSSGDQRDAVEKIIEYVQACGGVLTVLWHPHMFSEEDFPGAASFYEQLIRTCRDREAWFATGLELVRSWENRTGAGA